MSRNLTHQSAGKQYPLKIVNVVIGCFARFYVKIQEWSCILSANPQEELKLGKYGNYCLLQFPISNITNQHLEKTAILNMETKHYKNSTTNKKEHCFQFGYRVAPDPYDNLIFVSTS